MKTRRETLACIAGMAVGVTLCLVLRGAVLDTREVSKLRRSWEASGPQTTALGKMRGRLTNSWWLGPLRPAPLRDPFAECGLLPLGSPGAGGVLENLSVLFHSRASLECLHRQIEVARAEHEAFPRWLQVGAGCGLLFVFLVACSLRLALSKSRRGLPQQESAKAEEEISLQGTHVEAVPVATQEYTPAEARSAQAEEEPFLPDTVPAALQEAAPVEARPVQAEEEPFLPDTVPVALQEAAPVEARPVQREDEAHISAAVPKAVKESVHAQPQPSQAQQPGTEACQTHRKEFCYTYHLKPPHAQRLLEAELIRSLRKKSCALVSYEKATTRLLLRGPKHDAREMHNAIRDVLASFKRQDKEAADACRRQQWCRYTLYVPPRYVCALLGPNSTYLNNLLARYDAKVVPDTKRGLVHIQGPRNDAFAVYRALEKLVASWRWHDKPRY